MVSGFFSIPLPPPGIDSTRKRTGLVAPGDGLREFIAGPSEALLPAAVERLFNPEAACSPLVLYGPTGTGKSLLALALLGRWRQTHPNAASEYYTGSDFCRAYAYAVQADALQDWRDRLTRCTLLVIDGLEDLLDKDGAQQELTLLADAFAENNRRLLVTCRRRPFDRDFHPRLSGRLAAGLLVALHPPDAVARREIFQRLATAAGLEFTPEALDFLSGEVEGPVPQMRSLVQQFALAREQAGEESNAVEREEIERFLENHTEADRPTLKQVAAAAARVFGIRTSDLLGTSRRQGVVRARGAAMWLGRKLTGSSYAAIGRYFGRRDHTTVMHACRKLESQIGPDAEITQAIGKILDQLGSPALIGSIGAGSNFDVHAVPPTPG